MKHTKTTFVFTSEFGARLRQLRMRRNLSLRDLALLMDRRQPGSFNLLAKLERGDLKYPSINLIADFLRACGARVKDVSDLLDTYVTQAPVLTKKGDAAVAELLKSLPKPEQRAMLRWEKATVAAREARAAAPPEKANPAQPGKKKPRVETDRRRVFRIVWSFIHANWNEVFEQKLYEAMLKVKNDVPRSRRRDACNHGRRFFGILTRHYRHEARRTSALARVEREAKHAGFSNKVVAMLRDAANQAYRELFLSGRLDWEPTQEEIIKNRGSAPKVVKAETRLEIDEARPVLAGNKILAVIDAEAIQAVNERLEKRKVGFYQGRQYYVFWIHELIPVAYEHGTDSPEWKAEVAKWVPKLHDPEFAREAAVMVADIYNRWKVKLPPKQKTVNEEVA
jgi:transcriptional regulator with XRE-family HTH domain